MAEGNRIYSEGPAADAKAPILITQFDGALDAGNAGGLAVTQLLRNLHSQRVATFDTDMLLDYRSHRPIMEVENWVTTGMRTPEVALDLVHDDAGTPILILHGPEPDARWKVFTEEVKKLAMGAGVEVVFGFHGLPAAVPHSRPTAVHVQSGDADLVPEQPLMGGKAALPAPLSSFIQHSLHAEGLAAVTLLAAVPYYMSESSFPRASSALLRRLSDMADLSLPIGDLERGADADATQVEQIMEANPELQRTVEALEQHYDSISQAAAEGAELDLKREDGTVEVEGGSEGEAPTWEMLADAASGGETAYPEAEQLGEDSGETMADLIGDAIESYLRTRSKRKPGPEVRLGANRKGTGSSKEEDLKGAEGRHAPRHRALAPWELRRQDGGDLDGVGGEEAN